MTPEDEFVLKKKKKHHCVESRWPYSPERHFRTASQIEMDIRKVTVFRWHQGEGYIFQCCSICGAIDKALRAFGSHTFHVAGVRFENFVIDCNDIVFHFKTSQTLAENIVTNLPQTKQVTVLPQKSGPSQVCHIYYELKCSVSVSTLLPLWASHARVCAEFLIR